MRIASSLIVSNCGSSCAFTSLDSFSRSKSEMRGSTTNSWISATTKVQAAAAILAQPNRVGRFQNLSQVCPRTHRTEAITTRHKVAIFRTVDAVCQADSDIEYPPPQSVGQNIIRCSPMCLLSRRRQPKEIQVDGKSASRTYAAAERRHGTGRRKTAIGLSSTVELHLEFGCPGNRSDPPGSSDHVSKERAQSSASCPLPSLLTTQLLRRSWRSSVSRLIRPRRALVLPPAALPVAIPRACAPERG